MLRVGVFRLDRDEPINSSFGHRARVLFTLMQCICGLFIVDEFLRTGHADTVVRYRQTDSDRLTLSLKEMT